MWKGNPVDTNGERNLFLCGDRLKFITLFEQNIEMILDYLIIASFIFLTKSLPRKNKSIWWSQISRLLGFSPLALSTQVSTTPRNLLDTASIVYKSIGEIKFALRSHGRHEALWSASTSISSAQSFVSCFILENAKWRDWKLNLSS